MKLHLGCGQVYLEGYVNIDFPLSEHTLQEKSVADEFADLTKLSYKEGEVDEVRLHHVFEHFPRHIAIALLASWQSWLKKDGKIHIEVPDFDESARLVLDSALPDRDRKVALRHIFGSNEAPWATHYEGWSKERLIEVVELLGFGNVEVEQTSYLATRNVIIQAKKKSRTLSTKKVEKKVREYLRNFTVNDSEFETHLLDIWMGEFSDQLNKTWATK